MEKMVPKKICFKKKKKDERGRKTTFEKMLREKVKKDNRSAAKWALRALDQIDDDLPECKFRPGFF